MFNIYIQFIQSIFDSIFNGGPAVGFADYISVVGMTIGIVFFVILATLVISGGFWKLPRFTYKKLVTSREKAMFKYRSYHMEDTDYDSKLAEYTKKLKSVKIIYWGVFICLYLPVFIPTVLFLINLLFHI